MTKQKSDDYMLEIIRARFDLADLMWETAEYPTPQEEPIAAQSARRKK